MSLDGSQFPLWNKKLCLVIYFRTDSFIPVGPVKSCNKLTAQTPFTPRSIALANWIERRCIKVRGWGQYASLQMKNIGTKKLQSKRELKTVLNTGHYISPYIMRMMTTWYIQNLTLFKRILLRKRIYKQLRWETL